MSAFDDEFGLFGDDDEKPDEERKPTLGARQIATGETIIDEIEPEDERPRRRGPGGPPRERISGGSGSGERRPSFRDRDRDRGPRTAGDPAAAQARAVDLLGYLARKLVSKPDDVIVELIEGNRGPVIELEVHPDDFGKVIGKGGRVAQALRTLVRASTEGKVTIDIVDVEDDDEHEQDLEHAGDTSAAAATGAVEADEDVEATDEDEDEEEDDADAVAADADADAEPSVTKAPARRKKAAAPATARKKKSTSTTARKKSVAAPAAKRKKKS